ncbi:MAG: leucine-rich repeat protein [Clostridiales bacterium]|nr:leucine-rich repeat protein [Clostridiales bacterium]
MKSKRKIVAILLTVSLVFTCSVPSALATDDHIHDDTCGYSDGQCIYESEETGNSAADAAESGESTASLDSDTNDDGVSEGASESGPGSTDEGTGEDTDSVQENNPDEETGEGTEIGQENSPDEEITETGEESGEAADAEEETEESEESAEESLTLTTAMSLTSASGNGWTLDDNGKLTISSDTGMSDWNRNYSTYLSQVKSVVIGDSVTYLSSNGFRNGSFTSVSIGSGVTTISAYAFQYCYSLTSITINKATTKISDYAFYVDSSITDVFYSGSETEWNSVSISVGNTYVTGAFIHYNSSSAHTHTHSTSFSWSSDYSSCTVTISCSGCNSTKTLNCTVTSESTDASITYTAKAKIGTETYSDTKTVPRAPTPTVTISGVTTSSITVTAPSGTDQNTYGTALYSIDGSTWQESNVFSSLYAGTSYTVYVKYQGNSTYAESVAGSTATKTADATYTVTIPSTVTAGGDSVYITIDEDNLDLGLWGQVDVSVSYVYGSFEEGKLYLIREGDLATEITSRMLVNGEVVTSFPCSVATFKASNTSAVAISFSEPEEETILAGKYSGSLLFAITFSQ